MPYLEPAVVVEEFAEYTREEIRPAIKDDEQFIHAQAGSMSSTLRFLSNELREMDASIKEQDTILRQALDDIDNLTEHSETAWSREIGDALAEARTSLESPPSPTREHEQLLLEVCNDMFEVIEENVDDEQARELRRPLYRFIDARLNSQLAMLGRETNE